jgi:thiol:disulfide interchange protein DsbD
LTGLLLLAFGVFGGGLDRLTSEAGGFARLKKYLGLISLLIGAYLLVGTILLEGLILPPASKWLPITGTATSQQQEHGVDWLTDLETGLAQARAEGKPVFIDTWATWCANCRVLEKTTFSHPDVIKEADRFVAIRVQLEDAGSEITREFMKRFDMKIFSLPTTLLLDSEGVTQMIRQGVISSDDLIAEMQQLK